MTHFYFKDIKQELKAQAARAVNTFGEDLQLSQAQEELAEMIAAISHIRRDRKGSWDEFLLELGDVILLVEQMKIIAKIHYTEKQVYDAVAVSCRKLGKYLDGGIAPLSRGSEAV